MRPLGFHLFSLAKHQRDASSGAMSLESYLPPWLRSAIRVTRYVSARRLPELPSTTSTSRPAAGAQGAVRARKCPDWVRLRFRSLAYLGSVRVGVCSWTETILNRASCIEYFARVGKTLAVVAKLWFVQFLRAHAAMATSAAAHPPAGAAASTATASAAAVPGPGRSPHTPRLLRQPTVLTGGVSDSRD